MIRQLHFISKLLIIFLFLFCFSETVNSQPTSWQKLYDGRYHFDEEGHGICKADSSNFYIVGTTLYPSLPFQRIYLLKINKFGDTLWTRVFTVSNMPSQGKAIISDGKGNCILTGQCDSSFTIKINPQGNIIWNKTYGYGEVKWLSIKQASDKGYIILGSDFDYLHLMKIDSSGNFMWEKTYYDNYRIGNCIAANDGSIVLAGYRYGSAPENDSSYITKLDNNGNLLWEKGFRINNFLFTANAIEKTNFGYLVSGVATIGGLTICKFDFNGNLFSFNSYNPDSLEYNSDVKIYKNKYYLLLSNLWVNNVPAYSKLRVLDTSGVLIKTKYFILPQWNSLNQMSVASDNNVLFAGTGEYNAIPGSDNIYCIQTDTSFNAPPVVGINLINQPIVKDFQLCQNYPNPFNPSTVIQFSIPKNGIVSCKVFNSAGKELYSVNKFYYGGTNQFEYFPENLSSGIYFYSLQFGDNIQTRKMIFLK